MFSFLTISNVAYSQKKIKEGIVKFELDMDEMGGSSPEIAMLGSSTLDFAFKGNKQKMDMNMMGGMMRVQTIVPIDKPEESILLMDMMGQKIQLTELKTEDLKQNNNFMNMDDAEEVVYDEKDVLKIAGYPCYKAVVKMKNGSTIKYYITKKIRPPMPIANKDAIKLKGHPLKITIEADQGIELIFLAKEVINKVEDDYFTFDESAYEKMTIEEFEKKMGSMMGNGAGNN